MRKKHKEEVAELKAKIQEMEWHSDGWETEVRSYLLLHFDTTEDFVELSEYWH